MERTAIDEIATQGPDGNTSRRVLSELLGTTDIAINHSPLELGERFSSGLHAHLNQEEVSTSSPELRPSRPETNRWERARQ